MPLQYVTSTDKLLTSFQSSLSSNGSVHQEALSPHGSDKYIEAYVSAVNSATHFWLQVGVPGVHEHTNICVTLFMFCLTRSFLNSNSDFRFWQSKPPFSVISEQVSFMYISVNILLKPSLSVLVLYHAAPGLLGSGLHTCLTIKMSSPFSSSSWWKLGFCHWCVKLTNLITDMFI